jgi:hypothetical protein
MKNNMVGPEKIKLALPDDLEVHNKISEIRTSKTKYHSDIDCNAIYNYKRILFSI